MKINNTIQYNLGTSSSMCLLRLHSWKDRRFFVSSWLVVTESSRLEWDASREFSSSPSWSSSSCTSPPGHSTSSRPGRPVYSLWLYQDTIILSWVVRMSDDAQCPVGVWNYSRAEIALNCHWGSESSWWWVEWREKGVTMVSLCWEGDNCRADSPDSPVDL